MCFGTPWRDHVSTYLLLNDIHFRDVYNLIRLSSCLLVHSSSENTAHCEGALPVDSRAEFFIMRSDRVELCDLWIKKKLDLANMWADTILILFISICTALLGEGKSTNALINLLEEVKEFTPIQHVCLSLQCTNALFRFDMVDGIQNWEVSKAEGRGREAE